MNLGKTFRVKQLDLGLLDPGPRREEDRKNHVVCAGGRIILPGVGPGAKSEEDLPAPRPGLDPLSGLFEPSGKGPSFPDNCD